MRKRRNKIKKFRLSRRDRKKLDFIPYAYLIIFVGLFFLMLSFALVQPKHAKHHGEKFFDDAHNMYMMGW